MHETWIRTQCDAHVGVVDNRAVSSRQLNSRQCMNACTSRKGHDAVKVRYRHGATHLVFVSHVNGYDHQQVYASQRGSLTPGGCSWCSGEPRVIRKPSQAVFSSPHDHHLRSCANGSRDLRDKSVLVGPRLQSLIRLFRYEQAS